MVHTFKNNGYNIAIDSNSGAVHVLDELSYEVIDRLKDEIPREEIKAQLLYEYRDNPEVTKKDIDEVFDDVDELVQAGELFSADAFKDMAGGVL